MGPNDKEGAGDGGIALGEESELFVGGGGGGGSTEEETRG